jgi:hypothetical protein
VVRVRKTVLLLASMALAVLVAGGVALAQETDTTPPETNLTDQPRPMSRDVSPSFSFTSNEAGATFECKLDGGDYQSCTSPKMYTLLSEGQHTFAVRATDAAGNTDQTPAEYTWTVDSLRPKVTFTERPGYATGPDEYDEWITNDRSPTWAWTVEDPNPDPDQVHCYLYDNTNNRYILNNVPCSSPYTFEAQLPDGDYYFDVEARDKASNYGDAYHFFEVDTVAPKFVSGEPTGRRVSPRAWVEVTFDDDVYDSARFVNIYKRGSNTPLAVHRYAYGDEEIEISPKNNLKRGTWYTVKVITEVNDGANNLEEPKTWSFKTKG